MNGQQLTDEEMAFEKRPEGLNLQNMPSHSDLDSIASGAISPQIVSKLSRQQHLELLLQKANSISGIRKMNMQFKEERRGLKFFDPEGST